MIFEGQLERTGLDAVAFLSRTTFNSYIAPTPLERLEAAGEMRLSSPGVNWKSWLNRDSLQNTFE